MTSADPRILPAILMLLAACGGGGGSPSPVTAAPDPGQPGGTPGAPNVIPVSVDGATCAATSYLNEPCVSATVCVPGTATCQTIDGLLLDTGSTGLRVFSQVLTLPLPHVTAGGSPVAECVTYQDGSAQWGPVLKGAVVLGGEPAVDVPIQLIDATFSAAPSTCNGADAGPAAAGFNGILGVGVFTEDCGPACTQAANGIYFACGAACTQTAVSIASQVRNPVAALPVDNNGVEVRLPPVPAAGASAVNGALILGIGTRANNVPPSSVLTYPLDGAGEFKTTLDGTTLPAFVDTGSNGLFFPAPAGSGLVACAAPYADWYCPSMTVTLAATNAGAGGTPAAEVTFQIASVTTLAASVGVSSLVGGALPALSGFDWGLPFHLGRDVYLGLEGRSSVLGAGPFVAY